MDADAGNLGSAVLFYVFAFAMVIWMCVKIARGSLVLALLTFFVWPLALLSLIRNWGNPQSDIRIPFFAAVFALGLSVFMVEQAADPQVADAAPDLNEDELSALAQVDPDTYGKVMQARADYEASDQRLRHADEDIATQRSPQATDQPDRGPSPAPRNLDRDRDRAEPASDSPAATLDPMLDLAQTAAGLSYQYSRIDWPHLQAHLQLPSRFRFIPASRLHRLARLRSQTLPEGGLGWVSHETVDLGQPEAWVLEVQHLAVGRLDEGDPGDAGADFADVLAGMAGAPALDGSSRTLGSGGFAPQWDAVRGLLTWSLDSPEGLSDHHAALPLRQGALLFSVRGLQPDQRELGLRATRLLAASVEVAVGARWRDQPRPGDVRASVDLLQWIQARQPAPVKADTPGG
jgi:hypothetical protein